jgi:Dyp-type peroxidase family
MTQADQLSPEAKADIQGFITSGYGHLPHTAYLFVQFQDRARAQAWLWELLPHITAATSWRVRADAPKARPDRALNIAFTHAGLAALGLSKTALRSFAPEFRNGMASGERARILGDTGDSAPLLWEFGGSGGHAIHGLLILHAQTLIDLSVCCAEQREAIGRTLGGVSELAALAQLGERPEHGHEPFGFFDGAAQPVIKGIKGQGVNTGEFILGYENEYGFFPVGPVLPPAEDPNGVLPASANPYHQTAGFRDFGLNGSFLVYRKLAQDVAAFWRFLRSESERLKGIANAQFMVWLAAKMVGRWPSGAPLALTPDADRPEWAHRDDFLYAESDPNGLSCPFGSHIRRTHPRDHIRSAGPAQSLHMSARHRILRRGKVYGPPLFDPALLQQLDQPEAQRVLVNLQDDGQARGVHFLCVNADIKSQFEFIQQAWVNNPRFNGLDNNRDPLVGDNDPADRQPSAMLVPGYRSTLRTSPLPRFVKTRGGIYLFMPSLTALRYLAQA